MTDVQALKRRRLFVVWIATVAASAAVVLVDPLIQPVHVHILDMHVSNGLTGAAYLASTAMCFTTFQWFRTAPKGQVQIKEPPQTTVSELRRRAAHRA